MTNFLVHITIVSCFFMSWSLPRQEQLRFTRTFYNVTIPENSVSRTLVSSTERMGITRGTGEDHVTFKIVSGDTDKIFKVEDKSVGDFIFLVLRTRGGNAVVLNRERKDKFVLTIKAFSTRSRFEATTIVYVRVLDQNDLSPIFFPSSYNTTLSEDFGVYKPVLRVTAEDADLGVNGEIRYSLKDATDHFAVHPFTGVLCLTKRLKYSERSVYDLTIVAQDRATVFRGGGQSSLAKVTVRVRQVNLFGPEIYVYVLQEPSFHSLGWVYAVARVVDRDEGVHGEIEDVKIVNGDTSDIFTAIAIDESKNRTEYNIILTNSFIPKYVLPVVNLSLQVTDGGFPQRRSYKAVSLRLRSAKDNHPRFLNDSFQINVPEYLPQGSPLIRLPLENKEEILSLKYNVKITEGNLNNIFSVDNKALVLYLNSPLDAEKQRTFILSISIYENGKAIVKKGSSAKLKVNVIDCNDNSPLFSETQEEIWVNENQPAGTHVIKITATDSDFGDNGYITYSIVNLRRVPFQIDPLSGVLRSTQPLDYESTQHIYSIKVRASDSGFPFRRETEKTVAIKVRNTNDNRPIFTKGECSISIPKNLKMGTNLITITATDLDETDIITYTVSSSYRNDCIEVDVSKGILSLQCDLSEISKLEWDLNITANDGVHEAQTSLRVFVASLQVGSSDSDLVQYSCRDIDFLKEDPQTARPVDSSGHTLVDSVEFDTSLTNHTGNLHFPSIIMSQKIFEVLESAAMSSEVIKIIAIDKDDGFNGKLVFGLTCEPEDYLFRIDPDSGVIDIFGFLDYELQNKYLLNVTVCDLGKPQKCSSESITINIKDTNNNKPVFKQSFYKLNIPENTKVGEDLITVECIDKDYSLNQTISYHLMSNDNHFSIDRKSGSITLKAPLDRETIDSHTITIRTADGDLNLNDTLYSDVTVTFYLEDVNDNAPTFINSRLIANVPEDLPVGSIIFIINAVDKDLGDGGEIRYSLSNSDIFSIDPLTGVIKLRSRLDFESINDYRVVVTASDQGTPQLSSTATLSVRVTDVSENLHPPMFEEVVLVGAVPENMPEGTEVITVAATDTDPPGIDSKITYSIQGGSGLGYFTITEQGIIQTAAILDAEYHDHYWLTVVAEDCGLLPLSTTTQVYISVIDTNDRLPLTLEPFYYFSVEENLPSLTVVGHVTASDDDHSATNITYTLAPSITSLPFTIDYNTGLLSTTRLLDREDVQEYTMQVVISDRGHPSLTSTTRVRVSVVDVNDHSPTFTQGNYVIHLPHLPQPLPKGSIVKEVEEIYGDGEKWTVFNLSVNVAALPVFQVFAVDLDEGARGKVFYSVSGDASFVVHASTGALYPKVPLVPGSKYDFLVRASDYGSPNRSSTVQVIVYTPKHPSSLSRLRHIQRETVQVKEDLVPGDLVLQMKSPVADESETSYVISDGAGMTYLAMEGDGLLAASRLDCETDQNLGLTVTAYNHSHIWNIQVSVEILDVNEHPPEFTQGVYTLNVSEDTAAGSVLATLQASDFDVKSSLQYSVFNTHPGSEMFTLDVSTGDLILTGPLDRELAESHQITVQVADGEVDTKYGYARVYISVLDVNDNRPTWPKELLSLRASEDTEVGRPVALLVAADRDVGENGVVDYAIISGNNNETFKIQSQSGVLTVNKGLDYYQTPDFQLVIRALDRGSPPLESRITVLITIVPSEINPPRCLDRQADAWAEVPENTNIGEVIGSIRVTNLPSLVYEIQPGDPEEHFSVNPATGDLILQRLLDHETTDQYNISVSVTSMAGLKTLCDIAIYVVDYNDNAPEFKKESYAGFVSESAPPGAFIMTDNGPLRILVEDLDSGNNALLEFTIEGSTGKDLLTIDPITGVVRTTGSLDYEQLKVVEVSVSARDLGEPPLTSRTLASLTVSVTDVNDCPPIFLEARYNATVLLPAEKDIFVVKVMADDPDSVNTTALSYSIMHGNEDLALSIDYDSGAIYVQDPTKLQAQRVVVRVFDGKYEAKTTVDIDVKQRQPSSLRFQNEIYHGAVMENSTKTSVVAVVSVLGSRLNENIRFSILNRNPSFNIGPTSGVISTIGHIFDRESCDFYHLKVQGYSVDRQLLAYTTVNISVLDVNDNCPQFLGLPYRATVVGNATKGDFVFKVSAKDKDTGENGEVRFEMDQTGSEMFRIGRKSGEIRVKNLAFQNIHETKILVTANDGGIVPCYTTTTVTVSVIESSAPQWQRTVYKAAVSESALLFSSVSLSLKASAVNKVVYQLVNCSDFLLRHDTGELQVYTSLDRESTPLYQLTVRATDVVSGLSSDTLVLLEVTDVNDNPPLFVQDGYRARVQEDAAIGTIIAKVAAVDLDEGLNATIRYTLSDPFFAINGTDGTIVLQQLLDFESTKQHRLKVLASDSGVPQLSSFVYIYVEVLNVNDNQPKILATKTPFILSSESPRSYLIGKVAAWDEDNDALSYRIISRADYIKRTFSINKITGIIRVESPMALPSRTRFSINVTVDDGIHSTTGVVEVKVLPSNKNPPKFSRGIYETTIKENLPPDQLLIKVTAFDNDPGIFGNITYELPAQRGSKHFTIDKFSGEIKTQTSLDREETPTHLLNVVARDGGGLISWAIVKVKVIDDNDNKPVFELPQYYGCITMETPVGRDIIHVTAVDEDEGLAGTVSYSIIAFDPPQSQHRILIHPQDGTVSVKESIEIKGSDSVRLTIRASDLGSPPLHSDVNLVLYLSREAVPPPLRHFPSELHIPSEAEPGFVIHRFKSTSKAKFDYRLVSKDNSIALNSTGHLYLRNRSNLNRKKIGILAQSSQKNFTRCAFYQLFVEVNPKTYQNPAFVQEKIELSFPEDIDVGSSIYKVSTKKEDPSVLFNLRSRSDAFLLDPLTGWISLASPMDRESRVEHEMVLLVTCPGSVSTSSSVITVTVTDVNDNPHIFNQDLYNVAVKEDAPVGTALTRLTLTDPDQTDDLVQFHILAGDERSTFRISEDGRVVLARLLDREFVPSYQLTVVANDGVFTAFTTVNVVVIDINDEPHQCLHSLYNTSVVESQPPGHLVASILTSDPDLESAFVYRVTGHGAERFYVDNHGELRLKKYLDRETTPGLLLEVTVSDSTNSNWSCVSRVLVNVEDVNDNAPSFAVANETIMLTEDAAIGMVVTKINVFDYDEGENRTITLSLVNPSGEFNLSTDTGLLVLARPLPSGPGSINSVSVRAVDQGTPPLSAFTTLQVVVLGMNDDPPVYLSGTFHVTVLEDAPASTSLIQLKSFSEDVLKRTTVVYTILEGNGQAEFDIERRTGLLTTARPLDFETRQSYQLLILATSVGESSLSSYSSVNVSVLDVNDNAPLFKVTRYSVQVREDIEVGQIVLKVEAIDLDSGRNGMIEYSLDDDSMQQFAIDSFNGILMVLSALDREKKAQYNMTVWATDQGSPSLFSTASVFVEVLDVNDNPPVFLTPNVTAILQSDRMPGWALFHLSVTDADLSTNSTFSFHITTGNEKEMFRVDPDGTLRTTDKLNVSVGDFYRLAVKVEDGGNPTLYSSTWIYIKVVEPSKHPPVLHPFRVWVGVYEHQWSGGDLGILTASDLDPYDKMEFSVPSNSYFTIDPRQAMLKARATLESGVYSVNVSVTDGKFTTTSSVTVTVEPLTQDMLQTSVHIRLSSKVKQDVLAAKLPQFLSTLQSAFLRDISLISVQDIPNSTIGLLIAVDGGADLSVVREVMESCGLSGTTPQCDCRNGGVCQRQLQMMPEKTTVLSGYGLSYVTPGHLLTYYCICSMGYAGDHCEEIKCLCPPLQMCVPQKVGFSCIPPCSTNQTCPAAMTSSVTWSELVTCLLSALGVITTVAAFVVYKRYRSSSGDEDKYGSWGKHNCYTKKKSKLSNLKASQKPSIFTGSPNNGAIGRNNLECLPSTVIEGDVIPLDYLRNINPLTKMENDILQGHSSAPDLATCHTTDVLLPEDPARELAALDDQLSQDIVQYGFPPPGEPPSLHEDMEISL